jgi:hypothetical protein
MDAWGVYFIALIPLLVAAILWYKFDKMAWWEAVIMSGLGIITALLFNLAAINGMTSDVETWSGQVSVAHFQPKWKEYYEYAVYRTEYYTTTETYYTTDSKGHSHSHTRVVTKSRQVFDHWQPSSRWHDDSWDSNDTINGNLGITKERYDDICTKFGKIVPRAGDRTTSSHNSRMLEGDPNDYYSENINNHVYPTTGIRSWENRVRAAPSVFSYRPVPPNIPVFEYPKNNDHFTSDRILGPTGITQYQWDQINSELGPVKKINLILVNFGPDKGEEMAEYQESKWIGGKKNDLVICCGGGIPAKPTWVKVFGWTERELVKQDIQTIVMNNGLLPTILPLIKQEVIKNYEIKDWSKFDYLTVEIPTSSWVWMFVVVVAVTGGWCTFSMMNGVDKDNSERKILGQKEIDDDEERIRKYYGSNTGPR